MVAPFTLSMSFQNSQIWKFGNLGIWEFGNLGRASHLARPFLRSALFFFRFALAVLCDAVKIAVSSDGFTQRATFACPSSVECRCCLREAIRSTTAIHPLLQRRRRASNRTPCRFELACTLGNSRQLRFRTGEAAFRFRGHPSQPATSGTIGRSVSRTSWCVPAIHADSCRGVRAPAMPSDLLGNREVCLKLNQVVRRNCKPIEVVDFQISKFPNFR